MNGFGLLSLASTGGASIVAKPEAPPMEPSRSQAGSTEVAVLVEMHELEASLTGGLPILLYSLEWNEGGA